MTRREDVEVEKSFQEGLIICRRGNTRLDKEGAYDRPPVFRNNRGDSATPRLSVLTIDILLVVSASSFSNCLLETQVA